MGLDVVRVAVPAIGVVGDDDVGPEAANDGDEFTDCLVHVGVCEPLVMPRGGAFHAGVTPVPRAAKEVRLFDAEGVERVGEFADAVAAELVGGVNGQLGVALADDFALLAKGAGDDMNLGTARDVVGDCAAGCQRLVVRVGVDEEQTGPSTQSHDQTLALREQFATVDWVGDIVGTVRARKSLIVCAAVVLTAGTGCGASTESDGAAAPSAGTHSGPVPTLVATVLSETPHDPSAYTQGLELDGSRLFESTGQVGHSQLREVDPSSGAVIRSADLPPDFWGEGLSVVGDRIWQLTWRNGVAIEWDKATLKPLRQVATQGDGWGLCFDGERLIRSDGTDKLRFHDPNSFKEIGSVSVTFEGHTFPQLNELECVDGQVWANIYTSDRMVRIDPRSGNITGQVDATGLLDSARRSNAEVFNGIAFAGNNEFLLTGKYWPAMFRVRLTP
jgi:glutaminyl-peptide cyclotransferase